MNLGEKFGMTKRLSVIKLNFDTPSTRSTCPGSLLLQMFKQSPRNTISTLEAFPSKCYIEFSQANVISKLNC